MYDKIAVLGYSGHGFVVVDTALSSGVPVTHYCEKKEVVDINPYGLKYLGDENNQNFVGWNGEFAFILGVGDNSLRYSLGLKVREKHCDLLNVIHPTSSISKHIKIGFGNFISRQVSINPLADVGSLCILNTGCIIEHECVIGDGAHIAPGAVLAGNVKIGKLTFVGANSVIKQGIRVGSNVVIGAGSVILKNVPDNAIVVGNPGRIL